MTAPPLDFAGATVVVTGAGRGLGRRYAVDLGAAGASVVVNARNPDAADAVVAEIRDAGGTAAPAVCDARDGAGMVEIALAEFGRVDSLVVNAGIVRDTSFRKMTDEVWDEIIDLHLNGSRRCAAAVWPHMLAQGSGSIVLTTSGAGLHGNFGQANYSAAKGGVVSLAKTLAFEGAKSGVRVNAVAPMGLTDMTGSMFEGPLLELTPERLSPFVLALAHESCPLSGQVLETGGGWGALVRWERSRGVRLHGDFGPGDVAVRWKEIGDFTEGSDHPTTIFDALGAACDPDR
ncbi:SDR family NAD(P)-dependent oxidoreductase [Pseudonocardia sp. NPDC049154]|uniref:SDR family NAD(P)-dependent oxidoreductase n=1 Tax=Pseudonocardia sp. NPDC049154 TaxID=3155501 RepID=UPI0033F57EE8